MIATTRALMLLNDQILWLPSPTNRQEFTLVWDSEFVSQKASTAGQQASKES